MTSLPRVAVIGLGEAGGIYSRALVERGVVVTGHDAERSLDDARIAEVDSPASAVAGADIVLSLVGARSMAEVAAAALPAMAPTALYADLNTASPEAKRHVAAIARTAGVAMADVAVLAPLPREGLRTPLLASGDGADAVVAALTRLGMPAESLGGAAGDAAQRKLVRSVFMKGLATLVIETLDAAGSVGLEDWARGQVARELNADAAEVDRLVEGTHRHATRRLDEMQEARHMLDELGASSDMTDGTVAWMRRLAP